LSEFRVGDVEQIAKSVELATVNLSKRNGGYYLYATTYVPNSPRVGGKENHRHRCEVKTGCLLQRRKARVLCSHVRATEKALPLLLQSDFKTKKPQEGRNFSLRSGGEFECEHNVKRDAVNKVAH